MQATNTLDSYFRAMLEERLFSNERNLRFHHAQLFDGIDLRIALYALASLTVVRMLPVALALVGSGQSRATTLFIGWFGPRGLASVIFALLAIEELGSSDPLVDTALRTMGVVIAVSVVAHGVTGRPLSARYARARGRGR